jgi:N-acetylglutamate synthase-like GNAT family acetyltransferase
LTVEGKIEKAALASCFRRECGAHGYFAALTYDGKLLQTGGSPMSEQRVLTAPAPFSPGDFQVRSFQDADRTQVLRLHAAGGSTDSMDCDCATSIDQFEEKYFRRPQDHFWVADAKGQVIGTVAICVHDQNVAHLYCLLAVDDSTDHAVRRSLVQVAANHARRHGCLKLVVHAQVDVGRAAQFLHRLGFEFARRREIEKRPVLEFYLNLYEPPELGTYKGDTWGHKLIDHPGGET